MTDTIRIPVGPSGAPVAWATVELVDYEVIIAHRWYLSGTGYAFRTAAGKSVFMHREVLGFPDSEAINHINGDRLDNRRRNLEACTQLHNCQVGARATVYPLRDQIREFRLAGVTNRAIAERLGVDERTICRYAKHLPKAPHPAKRWTREALIEWTLSFYRNHGRIPTGRDYNGTEGGPWYPQVYRAFAGGITELRDAAGLGQVDLRKVAA